MTDFNAKAMGTNIRRVSIIDVLDAGRVRVRDTTGGQMIVRSDVRPKGSGAPAAGEVWLVRREGGLWWLTAQIGATAPVITGSRATADPVTLSLLSALASLGLVADETTA